MGYLDIESKVKDVIKTIDKRYIKAFLIAFGIVNLVFLYHTINFMFGDHDWNYIRGASYWHEGAFEGRPLHFVMQEILFDGQVLPILNNLFSFAFLVLGGILLGRYWKLPLTTFNYVVLSSFMAVLPYTLVWLYYVKDTLINLSLPFICVLSLIMAEAAKEKYRYIYHLCSIVLMFIAFSSYAAVINLYGVVVIGKMMIDYGQCKSFIEIIKNKLSIFVDLFIALILYRLTVEFSELTSDYNTQTISLSYIPQKLLETSKVMWTQFITPLPFMEYKYKLILMLIMLSGFLGLVIQNDVRNLPLLFLGMILMVFSSKAAYFLAEERGQILAEMENFAFVPRLDFYGLALIYVFGVRNLLAFSKTELSQKIVGSILVIVIFMSSVRDVYAQKVWELGFEAEMKAHERIVSRLESNPEFSAERKYRLLQIGSLELRKNYYKKSNNEEVSLDLLETSYTPEFMSRIVYNFYYPEDVFYDNATARDLSKSGQDYIRDQAKAWPSQQSIYIDGDIVIIVLNDEDLEKERSLLYY